MLSLPVLHSGGAVDEFTDDIGVSGMPMSLGDYMDQDPGQRHVPVISRPPRHLAGRVQYQRGDLGIQVRPHSAVQPDDLVARLEGGRPHVHVGFGVVGEPGRQFLERPSEGVIEVPQLHPSQVFDQPQQIGAGRCQRMADVVLREPVKLPLQGFAGGLKITVKDPTSGSIQSHRTASHPTLTRTALLTDRTAPGAADQP